MTQGLLTSTYNTIDGEKKRFGCDTFLFAVVNNAAGSLHKQPLWSHHHEILGFNVCIMHADSILETFKQAIDLSPHIY